MDKEIKEYLIEYTINFKTVLQGCDTVFLESFALMTKVFAEMERATV